MTVARVNVVDRFGEITLELERRAVAALDAAAAEAALVADRQANHPKPIAHVTVIPAHNIGNGYQSGVKLGPLARIFDHGSLGKRNAALKRPGGRPEWEVKRGENPYTAHRHDISGKGVGPRSILNTARKAGRKILVERLTAK